jgi:hypothetical protein
MTNPTTFHTAARASRKQFVVILFCLLFVQPLYAQVPTSGLQLWLRAEDITGLNNGDLVSTWQGHSGLPNATSSGIYRPTFVTNRVNGKPVVRFTGNGGVTKNQPLMTVPVTTGSNLTACVVFANRTPGTPPLPNPPEGRVDVLMGSKVDWPNKGFAVSTYNSYASTATRAIYREIGDPNAPGSDGTPTIRKNGVTGDINLDFDTFIVMTFLLDGVTNTGGSGLSLAIGGFRDSVRCGSNDIAEILLYDRLLTGAEQLQVEAYLSQRYNLAQSTSATPSIGANQTGTFVLGNTGATVSFTTASTTAGSLSASVTNTRPNIVGSLPTGIVNIANRFWTITQTGLSGFTYAITFDLSTLSGVQNFNTLKVLRRNNNTSPWVDVETISGVSVLRNNPFITVTGLSSFSDFTIGSDNSNPLPVELMSFSATNTNDGVLLAWQTASELNNAGFEVQRRIEKRGASGEWQVLGFVRGAGTTTERQSYSFLDRTATGNVQYRLKQIDFDGQFEYSNTIEINAGLPKTFVLEQNYPNPFNPTTVISYQLPVASEVSLKLFDVLGKEVATLVNERQEAGAYNYTLNASNLSSGVYFYRLQAGNFVQTKKMMLIK